MLNILTTHIHILIYRPTWTTTAHWMMSGPLCCPTPHSVLNKTRSKRTRSRSSPARPEFPERLKEILDFQATLWLVILAPQTLSRTHSNKRFSLTVHIQIGFAHLFSLAQHHSNSLCSVQLNSTPTQTPHSPFPSFMFFLFFFQIIECRSPLCISIASQHTRNKTIMYILNKWAWEAWDKGWEEMGRERKGRYDMRFDLPTHGRKRWWKLLKTRTRTRTRIRTRMRTRGPATTLPGYSDTRLGRVRLFFFFFFFFTIHFPWTPIPNLFTSDPLARPSFPFCIHNVYHLCPYR